MICWIIGSSLRLQFLVIILAAILLVFGMGQLRHMPIDVYPEFNPPLVEVQTEALGLSAAEMEALITVPLEADLLNGVAWLDQIYSESVAGLSSILLVFEPRTDPIRARQMVQERLTQTFALPNVSKPPTMLQPLSTTSRVMMVGLSSDKLTLIEMGVLARWNIKPRLLGVPGVANVAIWGQRERQLQVQVDPKTLSAQGVTLAQVIKTTGEALWVSPLSFLESSTPGTAGWIDTPNQRLSIRHLLPISSAEDLAKVAVVGSNRLLLNDVARVVEDHQPLIGDAIINNGPGLLLVIEKFPGANTLAVTRGVEEALAAIKPGLTGIKIDSTIFRPSNYIEEAIGNLRIILLIGAVLVILVLRSFFGQWRTLVISLVAIPLALVAAIFMLYLRGVTFNMMILAGLVLAFGIVIDDAIVDVENIARRLSLQRSKSHGTSTAALILEAARLVRNPMIFATLIILITLLPVFFMQGLSGAFFQPVAVSFVFMVLSSMAVALTVTPALSLTLLANGRLVTRRKSPLVSWLTRGYERILAPILTTPRLAYVTVGVVVLVGLAILPYLGISLLPSFRQTDLLIEWEAVPGTSRAEMNRITTQAVGELQSIAGVKNVGAHVGRAITGDTVVGINSAELWVSLDSKADYGATLNNIQEVIDGYHGLHRDVQTYQPERIGDALMEKNEDLIVRIYGYDLKILQELAQEAKQVLSGISGVVNVRADLQIEEPQVQIEVDLAAAGRHQVKPGDVRRAAATLLSGIQVGSLYEEQKVFDVVVWGVPEIRNSLTDIRGLMIDTPGGQVPLGELSNVRIVPAPVIIKRDAVSRFIDVELSVVGRDLASVAADSTRRIKQVKFPLEYHAEVLDASTQKQTSKQRMLGVTAVALIGIFLLMQASFGSWRLAFVTFLTLPMALVGGVVAVLFAGGILSLGSLFGFLTILGIAVRNSILLIAHCQHLEANEGETFGPKLVLRGARERLAPIMMTALATGLALLPIVLFGNIAGNEIVQPMAIVILSGLVTSTYLNLFIIPTLYLRFGHINTKAVTLGGLDA